MSLYQIKIWIKFYKYMIMNNLLIVYYILLIIEQLNILKKKINGLNKIIIYINWINYRNVLNNLIKLEISFRIMGLYYIL